VQRGLTLAARFATIGGMNLHARTVFERLFHHHSAPAIAGDQDARDQRLQDLSQVVSQLLLEVEALRAAVIELEARQGMRGPGSPYAKAYRETFLLSHNSAGVRPGPFKVMDAYDDGKVPDWYGYPLREVVMLKRLGYTDEEIAEYRSDVDHVSQLT
jgi:hypothetical protein